MVVVSLCVASVRYGVSLGEVELVPARLVDQQEPGCYGNYMGVLVLTHTPSHADTRAKLPVRRTVTGNLFLFCRLF